MVTTCLGYRRRASHPRRLDSLKRLPARRAEAHVARILAVVVALAAPAVLVARHRAGALGHKRAELEDEMVLHADGEVGDRRVGGRARHQLGVHTRLLEVFARGVRARLGDLRHTRHPAFELGVAKEDGVGLEARTWA